MNWKEWGLLFGLLLASLVVSRCVLPLFGVNTCMSGGCVVGTLPPATEEAPATVEHEGELK